MGAVKFMCKGANVMRPGITNFTDFEKNEIVCVIEEDPIREGKGENKDGIGSPKRLKDCFKPKKDGFGRGQ